MKKPVTVLMLIFSLCFIACNNTGNKEKVVKHEHHLNIPENGIESMMEANTSKIIEGTRGSIVITVGEVTRKKADISIKRNDRILDEKLIREGDQMSFGYEGNTYLISLKSLKKPLIGAGKAELSIIMQ